jgi:hypothetical protein
VRKHQLLDEYSKQSDNAIVCTFVVCPKWANATAFHFYGAIVNNVKSLLTKPCQNGQHLIYLKNRTEGTNQKSKA